MKFEDWYEENFGAVEPGVPFHLPVLKFAYESGMNIKYDPMERNADYERGFIDGRADQMKSSVDRAVNRMAQREWVGLTDEEIMDVVSQIVHYRGEYMVCVGNAIEAKLKEKNT